MAFTKGNQEAKKKAGVKQASHIGAYLAYIAGGAARAYYTKLEELAAGKELTEPEQEFMDRFEKNTEFVAPKLARTEIKHDGEMKFGIQVYVPKK